MQDTYFKEITTKTEFIDKMVEMGQELMNKKKNPLNDVPDGM